MATPTGSRAEILRQYPWLQGLERQRDFAGALIDNLRAMRTGPLAISRGYGESLQRYRGVILEMAAFYDAMWADPRKRSPYDDDQVRQLLREASAPID